ncbi:hypothetical protein BAG01nite_27230 [Brevibacillus agri]|uniref:Uncharacterized protein n=2 Tax=Brevibacillus TaxID=55080 RepID=A0A3M8BGN7_9BACL|nr:hypothetical protein BA6348_07405 [Brevibacillus agri]RNB61218.1 hypothetical protein EDM57_02370 [Brevibacillus gelatini]RNB62137.1 hypothetical protein EB820_00185 [Brevibacillus agri]GED26621.1 hypothetical protein BAG01nite_27230 [Brevibacillus agri]
MKIFYLSFYLSIMVIVALSFIWNLIEVMKALTEKNNTRFKTAKTVSIISFLLLLVLYIIIFEYIGR